MFVQELLDILNNKQEIPNPSKSELLFYVTNENEETIELNLDDIIAFDINSDIEFIFKLKS